MQTIEDVIFAPALGAFFYDDQAAIRAGRKQDGAFYAGTAETLGFSQVRQPATALSIGLVLSDGAVIWGDMVSVQYSGAAGRDRLFDRDAIVDICRQHVVPRVIGLAAQSGAENCQIALSTIATGRLPVAIEYGMSQVLLKATAYARRITLAEVVAEAIGLSAPSDPVPIFAQSGDDRRINTDKMIMKAVDVLPHGLINSAEKFGDQGETFIDYVRWVACRVGDMGGADYHPILHFDLYGWVGLGMSKDPKEAANFIAHVADQVPEFTLHIESPVDYGSRAAQIENYAAMVAELNRLSETARIVADEHCNTLDDIHAFCDARAAHIVQIKTPDMGNLLDTAQAIVTAKATGIGAYCGGTSAETDLSARACVHVALAARADMMLAKPGMGVDEGIMIVSNEQNRALAQIRQRA